MRNEYLNIIMYLLMVIIQNIDPLGTVICNAQMWKD